ncbi:MAG TPA: patatin-like phospholipase family protein [Byssovorax sp.]|jgi:predicted acylesterase/phospholipase RssA
MPLRGETDTLLGAPASTYEHGRRFVDAALDAPGRPGVFDHALASASFPVAFTPFELGKLGPCIDGGSVNNTPIKRALTGGATRVVVVTTSSRIHPATTDEACLTLVGGVAEILINERLFRDLHDAGTVNDLADDLDAFVKEHPQTAEARAALHLMLRSPRKVEIVEIRPDPPLAGNAFSGFFCKKKREDYIAAGRASAAKALDAIPLSATEARRAAGVRLR